MKHIFVAAAVLALGISLTPLASIHAASLLDRVNEALQAAGLPVTSQTQQSFATGVACGHYTSFTQLVNAMKWHKQRGRTLADPHVCQRNRLQTFTGVVTEVNPHKIEVSGVDKQHTLVTKKFTLTPHTKVRNGVILFDITAQQRIDIGNVIQRGSSVTVLYNLKNQAMVIWNLAPSHDQSAFFGPIDCPTCQAGVNHVDPVTTSDGQE